MRLQALLRALRPAALGGDGRERARAALGALLGLLATALITAWLAPASPWLVAPLGASAVLVFAVPASPLAQPWAVLGGNGLSALVGVVVMQLGLAAPLAAALAVALAIGTMFVLRCLHPPGGAAALLMVLSGITDPRFALLPVAVNSVLLVLVGMAYHPLTGRRYPHPQWPEPVARDREAQGLDADLQTVLARHTEVLDISPADLRGLLAELQLQGQQRRLTQLRCGDIMSRQPITVRRDTPLTQAWSLFREHRIKALPVVDAAGGVIGILTPADVLRSAEGAAAESLGSRMDALRQLLRGRGDGLPERVGEVMSREVRVARVDRHLAELLPLFAGSGHHHLPILGLDGRLVGILTQSDVVKALARLG
ncbi:HPP family protein [Inhella sp. 1Y17]|uniref:HPP family protein n=1 Tax=Inhella proteolytica TaxID=2795029 RepID=A0A931J206_9BURK|nr:HPP family protein [Inhella proteolytica]